MGKLSPDAELREKMCRMMRPFTLHIILLPTLLTAGWLTASAQDDEIIVAAMRLTGATDPEELDVSVTDRLETLREHPVRINGPRTRLLSCGLFSAYQVASLLDYRARTGDIQSLEEFSRVDGFSRDGVFQLSPFLSLEASPPGADTLSHSLLLRGTATGYAARYRFTSGERWSAGGAIRGTYADKPEGTATLVWNHRLGKVVLGNFHVRTGQGLALWSGFAMSSLSSLGAFARRGGGITPSWSWTPAMTGVAADMLLGNVRLSAFAARDGPVGGRAEWLLREGLAGLTVFRDGSSGKAALREWDRWKASLDGRFTLRGADLFAELALRGRSEGGVGKALAPVAKGGVLLPFGERWKTGLQLRALPTAYTLKKSGEYGAALGLEGSTGALSLTATLDGALLPIPGGDTRRRQLKALFQGTYRPGPRWQWDFRGQYRLRNWEPSRLDLRLEVLRTAGPWLIKWRGNLVRATGTGLLTYLEGGRKTDITSCFLRATLFRADDWADRIYSYERDIPGSFSVPAYYGRGVSVSAVAGVKWRPHRRFSLKAHARAAWTYNTRTTSTFLLKAQLAAEF